MTLDSMITDTVYDTMAAEDAVYVDASGDRIAVRVVPVHDQAVLLGAADIGVRGARKAFYMRKISLNFKPCAGDRIEYDGVSYCVSGKPDDINAQEWLIYVIT